MADPRLMSLKQRNDLWADHALAILIETAAVPQTAVTTHDLAAGVQERSGITTDAPPQTWLGKVLVEVARRTREAGEPDLVALVVQGNATVGPGYDAIRTALGEPAHGPADRERAAAEARLACYRRYAPDAPEDLQPLLRPVTSLESTSAAKTPKAARAPRAPREPKAPRETKAARTPRVAKAKPGHSEGPEREARFCPRCFLQMPLSGICPTCD